MKKIIIILVLVGCFIPAIVGGDKAVVYPKYDTIPITTTSTTVLISSTTPTVQPIQQVQIPATPPPVFGQSATNANEYLVFNPTTLLSETSIDKSQQSYAYQLITKFNSVWAYYIVGTPQNICLFNESKLAVLVPDWETNPISQLNYCNTYIVTRYGNWQNALVFFDNNNRI